MLNNSSINSITNDYAASLSAAAATGAASVPSASATGSSTVNLDNGGSSGAMATSSASWITSHAGSTLVSKMQMNSPSASGHWAHSASPAPCMGNMLDSNTFQPTTGHLPTSSLSSQPSTDPFGFVTAAAHANDLTKTSFYYASQFGGGIRGLSL